MSSIVAYSAGAPNGPVFPCTVPDDQVTDPITIASACAKDFFFHRNGCDLDWPQAITLRHSETLSVTHTCLVSIPSFHVVLQETRH